MLGLPVAPQSDATFQCRFSGEQHHLSFAGLGPRPAPQQHFEFFFTPDKLSHAARVQGLEAALPPKGSQGSPGSYSPRDALEVLRAKVLKLEQIAERVFACFRQ